MGRDERALPSLAEGLEFGQAAREDGEQAGDRGEVDAGVAGLLVAAAAVRRRRSQIATAVLREEPTTRPRPKNGLQEDAAVRNPPRPCP